MSICPFAIQRLLPESETQPHISPRAFIMHSAAGRGSLYNFFLGSSNLESHFWISNTGLIEQYVDTNVRADANLKANGFAISVETESSPAATERWTPEQAAALVALGDWAAREHGIPRVQIPAWNGAGFGWHIMFGAPGPWTPVAKSCPGPARVPQARDEIIPAIKAAGTTPPKEEGFMAALTAEQQKALARNAESAAKSAKSALAVANEAKAAAKAAELLGLQQQARMDALLRHVGLDPANLQ